MATGKIIYGYSKLPCNYLNSKIQCLPALLGNERKGRYVALLCHDSLIFKRLTNQELDAKIENYINLSKKEKFN